MRGVGGVRGASGWRQASDFTVPVKLTAVLGMLSTLSAGEARRQLVEAVEGRGGALLTMGERDRVG